MKTGYEIRAGAEELAARVLRDPDNWPSQQAGSEELRKRIALADRARLAKRQIAPFLVRYDVSVAA